MAVRVMHCLTVEFRTVFRWTFSALGQRPAVTLAKVEMMIHVSVKVFRSVVPGSRPDEYTVQEPLRAIVAVWSAVVGRDLVVTVRTNRRFPNAYRNLSGRVMARSNEKAGGNSQKAEVFQCFHNLPLPVRLRALKHVSHFKVVIVPVPAVLTPPFTTTTPEIRVGAMASHAD